jgi:hypothetical protein
MKFHLALAGLAFILPRLAAKSDDVNARPDTCVGSDGDFLDPEIVYEATEDGAFSSSRVPLELFPIVRQGGMPMKLGSVAPKLLPVEEAARVTRTSRRGVEIILTTTGSEISCCSTPTMQNSRLVWA